MNLYRFHCWEKQDPTFMASLLGNCNRTGRLAYFQTHCDFSPDITSMAVTSYITIDGDDPLIAVKLVSQPNRITLYAPLRELADEIAGMQDDLLWRMLRMTTRTLPATHRLA